VTVDERYRVKELTRHAFNLGTLVANTSYDIRSAFELTLHAALDVGEDVGRAKERNARKKRKA
jgi:hypothetical protein